MSYRRAWLLIDSFKSAFREPVTLATTGGKGGGGVALTSFGKGLVESYRALERDIAEIAPRRLRTITDAVNPRTKAKAVAARRPLTRRTARH
jgi:molybdate transport repressor ModE-like protein